MPLLDMQGLDATLQDGGDGHDTGRSVLESVLSVAICF